MRILFTGASGTVGRQLINECKRRGIETINLDLTHSSHEHSFSIPGDQESADNIRCNIADYRQLERAILAAGPIDYVYHLAAEFGRWNGEDFYEQVWTTNAVGTKNLIRLQEKLGFKMVFFSSSEVYGDYKGVMTEDVLDTTPIRQLNDYALSKWVNECQIRNSAEQYNTETVIVRLFNTYGPGEYYSPYRSVHCRFIYCALNNLPFVVHKGHTRTSTYIADTVRTLINITDNFIPSKIYNIASTQHHIIEELGKAVILATKADPSLMSVVEPEQFTTIDKVPSIDNALRDLDHRDTVTLQTGINKTVEWMRYVYKLPGKLPSEEDQVFYTGL